MYSTGNLILALANIIAILRTDDSGQYQLRSQTGARSTQTSEIQSLRVPG